MDRSTQQGADVVFRSIIPHDLGSIGRITHNLQQVRTHCVGKQCPICLLAEEQPVDRRQQLIDGGFDPTRADWIAQRERELQIEAAGSGASETGEFEPMTTLDTRVKARAALREEIGDYEYERYLAATGQSTKISVTHVLTDSPAQHAGLQVGDRIFDYDGERVFNMIELAERAQSGEQRRTVIVSIERDGAPMQIAVPEGPLGISGGNPLNH